MNAPMKIMSEGSARVACGCSTEKKLLLRNIPKGNVSWNNDVEISYRGRNHILIKRHEANITEEYAAILEN